MSGKYSGAQALTRLERPLAVYVYCGVSLSTLGHTKGLYNLKYGERWTRLGSSVEILSCLHVLPLHRCKYQSHVEHKVNPLGKGTINSTFMIVVSTKIALCYVSVLKITIKRNIISVSSFSINIKYHVSAELCAVPVATFLFHLISDCFCSTYQCHSTGRLIFPFHICVLAKTSAEIICLTGGCPVCQHRSCLRCLCCPFSKCLI